MLKDFLRNTQNLKKNLPHGFDKSADLLSQRVLKELYNLVNVKTTRKIFFKLCVLLKRYELYDCTNKSRLV